MIPFWSICYSFVKRNRSRSGSYHPKMSMEEIQAWRRERLQAAVDHIGGNKAALGRLLGYQDGSFVGQMLRAERPITEDTVLRLESHHEFRAWFSADSFNKRGPLPLLLARPVSQEPANIPTRSRLPLVAWRDDKMIKAQQRFTVVAPDDTMAPAILRGSTVIFDAGLLPARNGDYVLLKDMAGDWHIREYQGTPDGTWHALPQAERALTLESVKHGLEVLAIFDGTVGRRG
jgi:hypothetical protein